MQERVPKKAFPEQTDQEGRNEVYTAEAARVSYGLQEYYEHHQ
jgi:hypothetical protein